MSLNWNCSNVERYQELKAKDPEFESEEGRDFLVTRDAVVWLTLLTGFPAKDSWAITEQNWEEMYVRLRVAELVNGAGRDGPDGPVYLTPAEVKSLIGLSTNAGGKTDTQFWKWVRESYTRRAMDQIKRAMEDVK